MKRLAFCWPTVGGNYPTTCVRSGRSVAEVVRKALQDHGFGVTRSTVCDTEQAYRQLGQLTLAWPGPIAMLDGEPLWSISLSPGNDVDASFKYARYHRWGT